MNRIEDHANANSGLTASLAFQENMVVPASCWVQIGYLVGGAVIGGAAGFIAGYTVGHGYQVHPDETLVDGNNQPAASVATLLDCRGDLLDA